MNHRGLELTQTDSRAYINLGSMHASPHNKEALHGTWMQSRWSGRIQRTFWPKILIDSLKIIDCTNLSVNSPEQEMIYSSYFCLITLQRICAKMSSSAFWPFVMSLIPVSGACLVFSPLLNVCNGATKLRCEQEAEGLYTGGCKLRAQCAFFWRSVGSLIRACGCCTRDWQEK